ncbi:unnamed protein product [Amoebophrya sp. A25]|nr:unnamed protein product [Amoebophrya sp. A25]|eukprot:GSA25T00016974001.1
MINNFILCQYFYELTCTFLKPFLHYLVSNTSILLPGGVAHFVAGHDDSEASETFSTSAYAVDEDQYFIGRTSSAPVDGKTTRTSQKLQSLTSSGKGNLSASTTRSASTATPSPSTATSTTSSSGTNKNVASEAEIRRLSSENILTLQLSPPPSSDTPEFSPPARRAGDERTRNISIVNPEDLDLHVETNSNRRVNLVEQQGKNLLEEPAALLRSTSLRAVSGPCGGPGKNVSSGKEGTYSPPDEFVLTEKGRRDLETELRSHHHLTRGSFLARSSGSGIGGIGIIPTSSVSSSQVIQQKKTVTLLPAFSSQEFLENLDPVGAFASLPIAKVRKLYAKFIRGPHFEPWFRQQRDAVVQQSLAAHKKRQNRMRSSQG